MSICTNPTRMMASFSSRCALLLLEKFPGIEVKSVIKMHPEHDIAQVIAFQDGAAGDLITVLLT